MRYIKGNKCKTIFSLLLAFYLVVSGSGMTVFAAKEPYDTYNYDYREYIHYTPAAYTPYKMIGGKDIIYNGEVLGSFVNPQDICKSPDGHIYIADTGNQRIVVLNADLKNVVKIIDGFDNNGKADTFKSPTGVCVSEKNEVYIADSLNHRLVVLDMEDNLIKIVENPTSESLEEGYVFTPLKVAVDYADRMYVVAQNMFEGIMVFESNGQFTNFFGTINISISLWEKFWSRLATKEERSKQKLFIPTEFTGIDVDEEGFVYATNIDTNGIQGVRRLNPKGEDVIKKGINENVGGDLWTDGQGEFAGVSQFIDVVYRGNGIYSCLDRRRGRIFTYDHEGNLLYIFGGLGTQVGTFSVPVAIEQIGDRLVVLDAGRTELIIFDSTEYGDLINEAVTLRFCGDETEAVPLWQRVLELDENNELANTGIGKAYLSSGDYKLAMKYLELGMNRDYYSIAFRRYRNEVMEKNLSYVLSGVLVLVIVLIVVKKVKGRGKEKEGGLLSE